MATTYSVPVLVGGKLTGKASTDVDGRVNAAKASTLNVVDSKISTATANLASKAEVAALPTAATVDSKISAATSTLATKAELSSVSGGTAIDTSQFAKKTDLTNYASISTVDSKVQEAIQSYAATMQQGTGAGTSTPAPSDSTPPRVVPLALTLGQGDMTWYTKTTDTFRVPIQFNAPISKWRLHIQNINPRTGTKVTGAVPFLGLAYGDHNGSGGYVGAPTKIHDAFTTPADASEWVSPWFTQDIGGNKPKLLEFSFAGAPAAPVVLAGGAYQNGGGFMDTSKTAWSVNSMPFSIWIEAETPATTNTYAVFGDSLSVGIGAKLPVFQSALSQYARAKGGLPVHYAASGDTMTDWVNVGDAGYKVNRWDGLSKSDALLFSMGSNDVFAGLSLATLQDKFSKSLALLSKRVQDGAPVYLTTIYPRTGATGATEDVRRQYNAWLKTQKGVGNIKDVFDASAVVSADDETLRTEYADPDGTHLKENAYQAIANSLTLTVPAKVTSGTASGGSGVSVVDNGDGTLTLG